MDASSAHPVSPGLGPAERRSDVCEQIPIVTELPENGPEGLELQEGVSARFGET
jgi:hypothetical protein